MRKNISFNIFMVNLFIFRHGQTNKNLADIWQGSGSNDSLNETGFAQAKTLAEKTKSLNLTSIYASTLLRAQQTAEEIVSAYDGKLELKTCHDLREVYFGCVEGLTFTEVEARFGDTMHKFLNATPSTWDIRYPGGESKHEVFDRVSAAIKKIALKEGGNIGIVCHAGVLSSLACGFNLKNVDFGNCSILKLQYDETADEFTQAD